MTYAVNGLIQATDVNGFISTNTPNVNNIWGTGSGNSGYGQTAISTVTAGSIIYENPWKQVVDRIATMANHQNTTITALTPVPATGLLIEYFSALSGNLNLVNTNRLNAAAQGTAPAPSTRTTVSTWTNVCTFTFTINFSSHNSARYYFNAGGQLGVSLSHPAGTGINAVINDLCSELGTIWHSSPTSGTAILAGTTYNGITKVGGVVSARGVAQTNNGFYAWTGVNSLCYTQSTDVNYYYYYYYYYGNSVIYLYASYNGAGVVTLTITIDAIPNGYTVSAGTVASVIARPPSTAYLTQSWTAPLISSSVVSV